MATLAAALVFLPACQQARDPDAVIAIATAEASRQGIAITGAQPPRVFDEGQNWLVVLAPPPPGWKGGGVEVTINKRSHRVLGLERTK